MTRSSVKWSLVALTGLLGLTMSACGSSSSKGSPKAANSSKSPIQIAAIFSESGAYSAYGIPEVAGANTAVRYVNSHGGINGHPLQLTIHDDQSEPQVGVSVAQQLQSSGAVAVIGPTTAGTGVAISNVLEQEGIPTLTLFGTPTSTFPGKWIFQQAATFQEQAQAIVAYIHQFYPTKKHIGVQYQTSGYGNSVYQDIKASASNLGLSVSGAGNDPTVSDVTGSWKQLLSDGSDVLVSVNTQSVSPAITDLASLGTSVPLVESIGASTPQQLAGAGAAANGLPVIAYYSSDAPLSRQTSFTQYFEQQNHSTPNYTNATSWDVVQLLAQAMRHLSTINRATVQSALEKITDFQGAAGVYSFSATDHQGFQPKQGYLWLQYAGNGKYNLEPKWAKANGYH